MYLSIRHSQAWNSNDTRVADAEVHAQVAGQDDAEGQPVEDEDEADVAWKVYTRDMLSYTQRQWWWWWCDAVPVCVHALRSDQIVLGCFKSLVDPLRSLAHFR
eukprot:TRINITY_DN179233_c0_g1_i1.p1 TRINITY_DN179233_c0_g1~~TRINITY_DN179233_c0_g1_i1.p1  ORF type:complete len:103 (+),score=14.95 TRINITY_DN179233_c0_g1_i1:324-632(+)